MIHRNLSQMRRDFWARKEQDRIDGERWIMENGTREEKLALMGKVSHG